MATSGTVTAKDVAVTMKAWAQENNLLATAFPLPAPNLPEAPEVRDALFDSLAITALSERIFRSRGITGIAFNNAANEVIVFTQKTVPAKERKVLPEAVLQQVSIRYIHGGVAQAGVPTTGSATQPYVVHGSRFACGGSIHPARIVGAGTLGCLVRDSAGTLFGLTNNHVSGMCNYANAGEKILAPGHLDITPTGLDPFTLGYHFRSLPMVHGLPDNVDVSLNRDAALVSILDEGRVTSMQASMYDTPGDVIELQPGQAVEKIGRTTGYTKGNVLGQMVGPISVQYGVPGYGNLVTYFDPVFAVKGDGGPFSQPGDSGSLVTALIDGQRYAVGLVFAGDTQGLTFILPLSVILSNLNVKLINKHNI